MKITGEGTLDGSGRPVWDLFWKMRAAAPDPNTFKNVGLPRARLALIENSKDVTIEGVTFKDSQFWNLHLYRCRDVTVRRTRFEVPDDYKQAPSSDGIDLDSCQDVLIDGCDFSVTDDCIAAKGSKGPRAMEDADSPPVERIRVRNCLFRRGHQVLSCGSEATSSAKSAGLTAPSEAPPSINWDNRDAAASPSGPAQTSTPARASTRVVRLRAA